ncbi:outer membrane assembly lipoprotein YfiO [Solilutibacter silvestris]|uniref:Outer membrane assembly lipoprotein YfiO n=1 Tax=Solilutibacter silvestris TaxID=1645665 RepID=A0A2K1Q215_9GAMM|nr:outer membrane assembly lipoprotein YfiO [Lysobacter silvestris]PNS09074.1 hypothetical protein Lysil_0703 [Lysobacter silvestris]
MSKHSCTSMLLGLGLLAISVQAHASGDNGCSAQPGLHHRDYASCSDLVLISPGNDTRFNLLLLLADRGRVQTAMIKYNDPDPSPVPEAILSWPALSNATWYGDVGKSDDATNASSASDPASGRCISNGDGTAHFLQAVQADTSLKPEERNLLVDARTKISAACGNPGRTAALLDPLPGKMQTANGKAFAAYLMAAAVFYGPDPGSARPAFQSLSEVKQPWVREAALYMLARTDLNVAQLNAFSDYGNYDAAKVDQAAIKRAREGMLRYLKTYPDGAYAVSASGLMRRVEWLGGNSDAAAHVYAAALAQRVNGAATVDLLNEIDTRLLLTSQNGATNPLATHDPLLLAVDDLWRMRLDPKDKSNAKLALSANELASQQAVFANDPALFRYLQAVFAYHVQQQPAQVLKLLPAAEPRKGMGYVEFSGQLLRLMAMDDLGQGGVRDGLLKLLPAATQPYQRATLELALAIHDERHQLLAKVFAPDSQVRDPAIRRILLENVAGADILQQQAANAKTPVNERNVALFVLLYRDLMSGRYAEFNTWLARVPADAKPEPDRYQLLNPTPALAVFHWAGNDKGYTCPALSAITTTLARTPDDAHANLCLGEFLRLNRFDHITLAAPNAQERKWRESINTAQQLGTTPLLFPGMQGNRQAIYRRVIADGAAGNDDRAYALVRAIRCYAPSGNNDCGGEDVPVSERKRWFTMLKTTHKSSHWASSVEHYW